MLFGLGTRCRGHTGSNDAMSQVPLISFMPTLTALAANAPAGSSLPTDRPVIRHAVIQVTGSRKHGGYAVSRVA